MEITTPAAAVADELDIAIVGMACRFPGARNLDEFWRNLAAGIESITQLSDQAMLRAGVDLSFLENSRYVKAAPILDRPGLFDAAFFGVSPAEARTMDPQHRILLELAHEALENAGCDPDRYLGRIAVFTGAAMNTYFMKAALSRRFIEDYIPTLIANDKDFLSTRLSYKLNLKGPSITVQTACSTSLVAIHLARQSLLAQETDMALAGAISVRVPHEAGYLCEGGGIVSPDGHVRAFDAKANGTVFGSGGGIIVLKRLADAIADQDTIHAVIKGSAVNNDGSEKAGYTAPGVNGQAEVMVEALTLAEVEPDSISYVEAHGSGTPVGDPLEVMALTKAFRTFTQRSGYCAIGSVKTNIGHLDAAAGIAGVIKTVLALKHRQLPPSLNYSDANPEINFPATPFFVNTELSPWTSDGPQRAAVMSTGMGGTNACVVLQEAPASEKPILSQLPELLVLSAKTDTTLDAAADQLLEFLKSNVDVAMYNVAYTLQTGRKEFAYRNTLVCKDRQDAIAALSDANRRRVSAGHVIESSRRPIIFLLPGVGDHYVGMARGLYKHSARFRSELDRCAEILQALLKIDIRDILYPASFAPDTNGSSGRIDLKRMLATRIESPETLKLNETIYVQPALFSIEYALARLWQSVGVIPDAIVGHSMGEYVAACLAGVFSLEDGLRLIVERANLVNELPEGAMLAVLLSEADLLRLLSKDLSISLINGAKLCVVAGPVKAIADFEKSLNDQGVSTRRVRNAHAFHSRMLDPIVPLLVERARNVQFHEPNIPYISNVTGRWITETDATDPTYWARHASQTARFSDALRELSHFTKPILLEVGPGKTLGLLAAQQLGRNANEITSIASVRHDYENQSDIEFFLGSVGKLWVAGSKIDWENIRQKKERHKVPLPTYPFERQNYWIETDRPLDAPEEGDFLVHKTADLASWFYVPSWKRALSSFIGPEELSARGQQSWLVFCAEAGLSAQIVDFLSVSGQKVVTVHCGERFQQLNGDRFTLRPGQADDYETLCRTLQSTNWVPEQIVHAWNLAEISRSALPREAFQRAQDLGFYSLGFLVRALAKCSYRNDLKLFVVSNQVQEVYGNEAIRAEKATLLGPCMVIPQEYPNIRTKSIDIDLPDTSQSNESAIQQIVAEFFRPELFVAHRNKQRWVQTYEHVNIDARVGDRSLFRQRGVYLITGGLGNIGCTISKYLAKNYNARLVLLGRSTLPPRELWGKWPDSYETGELVTRKIKAIQEIEDAGGEVVYFAANVSDLGAMRRAIERAHERFGTLNGVIHGAGVVGNDGYREMKDIDFDHCESHFQAKARGLHVLQAVLKGEPLDFCLLLSSLTSVLGGIGQAAYAASNVYIDAFARQRNGSDRMPWLSVNWDVWRVDSGNRWGAPGLGKTLAELGMTADEALEALELALQFRNANQLVVSTGDLESRIRQWIRLESRGSAGSQHKRITETPRCEAGPTENTTQKVVAQVWQNVLGIDEVGLNEHFSDLGGHSLLAIKIVAELRKAFQIDLPVRALFETPTVRELSANIDKQRSDEEDGQPRKPVHLAAETPGRSNDLCDCLQRESPDLVIEDAFVFPEWFVQQRSWIESYSRSDSVSYNYPLLLRISGPLNETALQHALQQIVQRHEVLRSVFRWREGNMIQIVIPLSETELDIRDLSGLPETERQLQCQEIVRNETRRAFDPGGEPLLRAGIIRLAPEDHFLQLTTHHLVHDDWSTTILSRELVELYQAFLTGEPGALQELSFQYGDFVRWQQQQLTSERLNTRLSYWKRQFDGVTGFNHLATDFTQSQARMHQCARENSVLRASLAESLAELGRRERVSLFMVLLAGFQCLLHHCSNDEEIGIGTCAANRSLPEVENLIGHFGNDLLLRTSLSGNPTFRELLMRTRETALAAFSNQDVPFGTVLKRIMTGFAAENRAPFQTMFILQNASRNQRQFPGVNMSWLPANTETAKHDLIVWLKTEPRLEITLEYSTGFFQAATMRDLLGNYQRILERMVKDPGARIGSVSLSTDEKLVRPRSALASAKAKIDVVREDGTVPKDDTEARLVELWETAFKRLPIGTDQNFFELGGDSLLAARLFAQMEKSFQMELPLALLLEAPTISQLAGIISQGNVRSTSSSLVAIQSSGTKPPLFCVHGHMGEVFYCRNLSRALGPDQPLYGLRSQGLGGGVPRDTVEEMAAHYLEEVRKVQLKGPYFLAGFCLGGMVAFEMARLLKAQSEAVALLVLFNAPAPGGLEGWPLNRNYLTKRVGHELKKLQKLPMRQRLTLFAAKTTAFASLMSGLFMAPFWRSLRSLPRVADINVSAAKAYYPGPYPGRTTLFLTEEVASLYALDPAEGWRNLSQGGIEVNDVAGDNNSMFDTRFVSALAQKLRGCIAEAQENRQLPTASFEFGCDELVKDTALVPSESI